MQNRAAVGLEERIGALAARIHAATAELVDLSAGARRRWRLVGYRDALVRTLALDQHRRRRVDRR